MSVAVILVAPSTTWLLVRTSPFELRTMPVPAPAPPWYPNSTLMSTSAGLTLAAIAEVSEGPPLVLLGVALPLPFPVEKPPPGNGLKLPLPLFALPPVLADGDDPPVATGGVAAWGSEDDQSSCPPTAPAAAAARTIIVTKAATGAARRS